MSQFEFDIDFLQWRKEMEERRRVADFVDMYLRLAMVGDTRERILTLMANGTDVEEIAEMIKNGDFNND